MDVEIKVPAKFRDGWDLGDKNFKPNTDEKFGDHTKNKCQYEFLYYSNDSIAILVCDKRIDGRVVKSVIAEPDPDAPQLAILSIDGIDFILSIG